MAVMNVINKVIVYLARIILVIYGLINMLGIFWHMGSIYLTDLLRGIVFFVSALTIGFLPLSPMKPSKADQKFYIILCVLGIISCAFLGVKYMAEEYRNLTDVLEQALIAGCFIFMLIQKIKR